MSNKINIWEATVRRNKLISNDEDILDLESSLFKDLSPEVITPRVIVDKLNKYVVGQEDAKKSLAVSVFNRLLALRNKQLNNDLYFEKHNILFIGNTGCGKTHLIKSLNKALSIPISIQDATTFTSAGYVGRDVTDCLQDLVRSSKEIVDNHHEYRFVSYTDKRQDVERLAQYGIVFLDEIDKIRSTGGIGKDVNGKAVQEALLRLVEGKEVDVIVDGDSYKIDTSNVLFIISGAFSGLIDIIQNRTSKAGIGFGAEVIKSNKKALLKNTTVKDLTAYGMIPELLGRFPGHAVLDDLTKETLVDIFIYPSNSVIKQLTNEFKSFNVDIGFERSAIEYIAEESIKLGVGARSLKSTAYRMLQPVLFSTASDRPTKTVVITQKLLESNNAITTDI